MIEKDLYLIIWLFVYVSGLLLALETLIKFRLKALPQIPWSKIDTVIWVFISLFSWVGVIAGILAWTAFAKSDRHELKKNQ